MEKISLTEILKRVREYEVIGNENCFVTELLPVDQAKETSLAFIDKNSSEKKKLILTTKAQVIICDQE